MARGWHPMNLTGAFSCPRRKHTRGGRLNWKVFWEGGKGRHCRTVPSFSIRMNPVCPQQRLPKLADQPHLGRLMASPPAPSRLPPCRRIAPCPPDDPQHHAPPPLPGIPAAPQTIMAGKRATIPPGGAEIRGYLPDRVLTVRKRKRRQDAPAAPAAIAQINRNPYQHVIHPARIHHVLMKPHHTVRTYATDRTLK